MNFWHTSVSDNDIDQASRQPASAGIRLVALDLDGTLLRHDKTISERTRRVLARLPAAGVLVVLVSGRPPRTLRTIAHEVGLSGLAICCNGAIVYDLERDAVVQHAPLDAAVAQQLIQALREQIPGVCFAFEFGTRFACDPPYSALIPAGAEPAGPVAEALALCSEPVTKLIVRHADLNCEALRELATAVAGEAAVVSYSGAPFVEVSAAGVHKAWALAALCAERGIDAAEVIAFGDMPNDLPMLRWAGRGVAVANAHPEVLAQADEVTLSNDEDGVAVVLERLLV